MAENYFGITDTGRQRDNNEDTFIAEKVLKNQYIIVTVIDGVGGYEGGEVAAQIARDNILQYFSIPSGEPIIMMKESLTIADEKIHLEKIQGKGNKSMACVVTMALADIKNNKFFYAHVGDTRLYLLRDQSLVKITKDHSFVGFLEDSNRLSEAEAMSHPKRNEINKALGFDTQIRTTDGYIETGESPFLPGDLLLLCSDGLSDLVNNKDITSILVSNLSLEEKGKALIEAANNAGGKDNITVVMVQNNSKPVKQKATKPVVLKKKEPDQHVSEMNTPVQQSPVYTQKKTSGNKGLLIFLSLLSALLIAALIWLLFFKDNGTKKEQSPLPLHSQLNGEEKKIRDSLGPLSNNLFVLSDSAFVKPIILSDSLIINKDSLHILGAGHIVLARDSSFSGPAFFVSPNCQYILLENIKLDGFDLGIVSAAKSLHLKNVQFLNCRIPLQYQQQFPDNAFVTGTLSNNFVIKTDSLVLKTSTN